MPKFGEKSKQRLETCHNDIQKVFNEVIKHVDCTIIEGHRTVVRQQELYNTILPDGTRPTNIDGVTTLGNHNYKPSKAVDVLPWPIEIHGVSAWHDRERLCLFAGFVLGIARMKGIVLVSGIDWNRDFSTKDTGLFDGPHFEII